MLRRALAVPSARRAARAHFSSGGRSPLKLPHRLAPEALVSQWLNNPHLVEPSCSAGIVSAAQSWWRRWMLFLSLRTLPGLDLPDFLDGARLAYGTVSRLMYRRDWAALDEGLVHPKCREAMQQAMEVLAGEGRRVVGEEAEGAIRVQSAVLHRVNTVDEGAAAAAAAQRAPLCHLDVKFEVQETFSIMDFHENAPVEPFDGRPRLQQSIWRFEGRVPPPECDAAPEREREDLQQEWRVYSIIATSTQIEPT